MEEIKYGELMEKNSKLEDELKDKNESLFELTKSLQKKR